MAKNFLTGPNWIPAIDVARLGPLSYLLELQLWGRHMDHIKSRGISPVSHPAPGPDPEPESPGSDTATPEGLSPSLRRHQNLPLWNRTPMLTKLVKI